MSDENTKLLRIESFCDKYLAMLITLPPPATAFALAGMIGGAAVMGWIVRGWFA